MAATTLPSAKRQLSNPLIAIERMLRDRDLFWQQIHREEQLGVLIIQMLVSSTITVTSMLTLAFAPISLFFLITAPNYDFFKLLNVAIFTLTGGVGLKFLLTGMRRMNELAHL
jgi:hypothetical protein